MRFFTRITTRENCGYGTRHATHVHLCWIKTKSNSHLLGGMLLSISTEFPTSERALSLPFGSVTHMSEDDCLSHKYLSWFIFLIKKILQSQQIITTLSPSHYNILVLLSTSVIRRQQAQTILHTRDYIRTTIISGSRYGLRSTHGRHALHGNHQHSRRYGNTYHEWPWWPTVRPGAHWGNWQPQRNRDFRQLLKSWKHVSEWGSANWGNGNATRGETEKLNFQATVHDSLLTIELPSGFLEISCSVALQWFICLLRWHGKLTKLLILFLCS
jgi:hypothetical protein